MNNRLRTALQGSGDRTGYRVVRALMLILSLSGLALLAPGVMRADTMYTYTGNNFNISIGYKYSDSISGFFTVPTLPSNQWLMNVTNLVTDFSFTDGEQTLTASSPLILERFDVETDAAGAIKAWGVFLSVGPPGEILQSVNHDFLALCGTQVCQNGDFGSTATEVLGANFSQPGTWQATTTTPVPEPSNLPLLGSGLVGGVGVVLYRMKTAAA